MPDPLILSWSGGKDSALALHRLRAMPHLEVAGLLTTVVEGEGRVATHGFPVELLRAQAASLGLPVTIVELPAFPSNEAYAARLGEGLAEARSAGVRAVAFGDLFLEDVRRFREALLAPLGMRALFPLWGADTAALAEEFVSLGFRALTVCVDSSALDPAFAGRAFDRALLDDLPPGVDPGGENGEFHTFVHDGPGFACPVAVRRGDARSVDGRFWICDLRAAGEGAP